MTKNLFILLVFCCLLTRGLQSDPAIVDGQPLVYACASESLSGDSEETCKNLFILLVFCCLLTRGLQSDPAIMDGQPIVYACASESLSGDSEETCSASKVKQGLDKLGFTY
jgi:hypothetical protein